MGKSAIVKASAPASRASSATKRRDKDGAHVCYSQTKQKLLQSKIKSLLRSKTE